MEISIGFKSYGFEFNLELICTSEFFQKAEIALAATAHALSAFWKPHKWKLIPHWR